jgi:hypothetical protein
MASVVHHTILEERESIEKVPRLLLVGECFELLKHDEINGLIQLRFMDRTRTFYAEVSAKEELP